MKNVITILLLAIITYSSFAQSCEKENVATSTDWRKYNPNDRNFPNNWDWTQMGVTHPVYLNANLNNPSFLIELPYFCGAALGSGSCGNTNTFQYERLENDGIRQDIYPEDGWELLVKNFGTPNPSATNFGGRGVANPFFVLYNRHNGKMKVYYAIIGKRVQNTGYLEVTLKSDQGKRATFMHARPVAQPLQTFRPFNKFTALNDFAVMTTDISYYWLVGEVQTAYDPCTCTSNLLSNPVVIVQPYLSTVTTIKATIDGQSKQDLVQNGQVKTESDGKTSFLDIAVGAATAGIKSYTQFEGYRKTVVNYFDGRNNSYKEKILRSWWNDNFIGDGINVADREAQFKQFLSDNDDNFRQSLGIQGLDKYASALGVLKQIAGASPYVGIAIGLVDFFINGGKKDAAAKPSAPMVFETNLKLSGELITPQKQPEVLFDLPGSNTLNGSLSPLYNRTLGVFNILKAPAMEFFELKPTAMLQYGSIGLEVQKQSAKQFRLKEDVKYVLNPNSGLVAELIDACFVLEYKGNQNLFINQVSAFDTTPALPLHSTIQVIQKIDVANNVPSIISLADRIKSIEESGWDLEYMTDDYPKGANSFIRFRTKYMPLQCLKNLNFVLWGGKAPKLYLKMLVRTKRKDLSTAEPVNSIVTYDVSKSIFEATKNDINGSITHSLSPFSSVPIYQGLPFSGSRRYYDRGCFGINYLPLGNPYYKYPANFRLPYGSLDANVDVSGDIYIDDYSTIGDNLTLKAMGKIIIGSGANSSGIIIGKNVTFIAGNIIIVSPNIEVPPTTTFLIEPSTKGTDIFGCNNFKVTTLEATNDEIYSISKGICNNKTYKDSTRVQTFADEDPNAKIRKQKAVADTSDFNVTFDCVPNPFVNFFTVNYDLNTDEFINITLYNSLGQVIKLILDEKVEAGSHQIHVSTEQLPPGMYIVTLRSKNGLENRKIIKQ